MPIVGSLTAAAPWHFGKNLLESLERAEVSLCRGALLDPQHLRDLRIGELLEMAQRQDVPVRGVHCIQRLGQSRLHLAAGDSDAGISVTLWVEAVRLGSTNGDQRVAVSVDPDGDGALGFAASDAVRFTPIRSRESWQRKALATAGINPAAWNPDLLFPTNKTIVEKVYDYYTSVYNTAPQKLLWAGLAKMAGGVVYEGLLELSAVRQDQEAWQAAQLAGLSPEDAAFRAGLPDFLESFALSQKLRQMEAQFLRMHKAIFEELAWQHEAYITGGIEALRLLEAADPTIPPQQPMLSVDNLLALENIDSGTYTAQGNRELLQREQLLVLQPFYDQMIPYIEGTIIGRFTRAPLPTGISFTTWCESQQQMGITNIADYNLRWGWITGDIVPSWEQMTQAQRDEFVNSPLGTRIGP